MQLVLFIIIITIYIKPRIDDGSNHPLLDYNNCTEYFSGMHDDDAIETSRPGLFHMCSVGEMPRGILYLPLISRDFSITSQA